MTDHAPRLAGQAERARLLRLFTLPLAGSVFVPTMFYFIVLAPWGAP